VKLNGPTAFSVTTTLPNSGALQTLKAGVLDGADNASVRIRTARIRAIQETGGSPGVVYTGAWSSQGDPDFLGGSVRFASAPGRRARLRVSGVTDLAWVTTRRPNGGRADVYVDGRKRATIDLYAAVQRERQVVYATSFASPGTHTIEVRVRGTRNAASSGTRVDLDAFELIRS
jgi:hypothetical protein